MAAPMCRPTRKIFCEFLRCSRQNQGHLRCKHATAASIRDILQKGVTKKSQQVAKGWVRSVRVHKEAAFVHINDGSTLKHLQIVTTPQSVGSTLTYGSCVEAEGEIIQSAHSGQSVELLANRIAILGSCDQEKYPFKSRQRHPAEYVREHLHLRPRTNAFGALLRVRNEATQALHAFFQNCGYCLVHTPVITANDCEGAGQVFQVEPANKELLQQLTESDQSGEESGSDQSRTHFFNVPAFLTVSGQLHLEAVNGAFSKVYTFGPTFRAENSHGRHHLCEFYMAEAEIAFTETLEDILTVTEALVKHIATSILEKCPDDFQWCLKNMATTGHQELINKLVQENFTRLSYTEAIQILEQKNKEFVYKVKWGSDLQKEHEKFLTRYCGQVPVFITDYPKDIKPFYARCNDNNKTVAAVDLLAPEVGEICGGSLREERPCVLEDKLDQLNMLDTYQWYLDLRRFGTVPHGGFGIGFERLLQVILGISNIKDTIPFPRWSKNCKL